MLSEDPRSKIKFLDWLKHENGVYWITGKPGSGKSTLMKFIDDHDSTRCALEAWTGTTVLVKASYYFWNPGTEMQKSLQGLLQSLLYKVLASFPELIPTACKARWGCHPHSTAYSESWSVKELTKCFTKLNDGMPTSLKLFFLVDGLDEYHGNHEEVIHILQDLASSPNIKLCVSSRPWNIFEIAFGTSNARKLYLHTLTSEDIELFTKEQLSSQIKRLQLAEELIGYQKIVTEIVTRAKGVFLWVCLVVRSLRDGLLNGDSATLLQERLAALPTDLEPFFEHIINSVDAIYKSRMASTFLVALETKQPLQVIHYSFLEDENADVGLSLDYVPYDDGQIRAATIQTLRCLNGRYKGLLEASAVIEDEMGPFAVVDFLHRTLRDFLQMRRAQAMLRSLAHRGFDARNTIKCILLAEAKMAHVCLTPHSFAATLDFAQEVTIDSGDTALEYSVLDHIELVYERRGCFPDLWPPVKGQRGSMLMVAAHIGRADYLNYRLANTGHGHNLDVLLRHALLCRCKLDESGTPTRFSKAISLVCSLVTCCYKTQLKEDEVSLQYEIVHSIHQNGGSPHALCEFKGLNKHPIWEAFLRNSLLRLKRDLARVDWPRMFNIFLASIDVQKTVTDLWPTFMHRLSYCEGSTAEGAFLFLKTCIKHDFNHISSRGKIAACSDTYYTR